MFIFTKIKFIFFNTDQVTKMTHIFSKCLLTDVLNSLPFNTTKVTNISHTPQKRELPKETNLFAFNTV